MSGFGSAVRYPTLNLMHNILISLLALFWISSPVLAQEQPLPSIRG
jgi:hypothetical protein